MLTGLSALEDRVDYDVRHTIDLTRPSYGQGLWLVFGWRTRGTTGAWGVPRRRPAGGGLFLRRPLGPQMRLAMAEVLVPLL